MKLIVTCPTCGTKGELEVPETTWDRMGSNIIMGRVPSGKVCEHGFKVEFSRSGLVLGYHDLNAEAKDFQIRPVSFTVQSAIRNLGVDDVQEVAFEALRPGGKCSEVDEAVRRYYEAHDLMPYWKHHTGHGIGLRYHEGPFLDSGDHTVLQPGMVLTVEPGLYVAELGGFRHSDTVVITEDGLELITYYPRDLESLTIPI